MNLIQMKLLLSPRGQPLDSVPGGIPEMTVEAANYLWGALQSRDASAAIMVDALYSEPLKLTEAAHIEIRRSQLRECWRRARALEIAKLALHIAEEEADGSHGGVHGVRRAVSQARGEVEAARLKRWPVYSARYRAIRNAAAAELMRASVCKVCAGRRTLHAGDLVIRCDACQGRGRQCGSERTRAETIGVSRMVFQRDWSEVYDWTLGMIGDKRAAARKIVSDLLMAEVAA